MMGNVGLMVGIEQAAKYDPERARLAIIDKGLEPFGTGLVEALRPFVMCGECGQQRYNPWAYRAFQKVARLTDDSPRVMAVVFDRLGVRNEPELMHYVSSAKRIEDMSEGARAELLEKALIDIWARNPELRSKSRLALMVPEANGNGVAKR